MKRVLISCLKEMALFVTLLCISIALLWYYFNRCFSFWRRHGVEEWKASSIFGNFAPVFLSSGNNEADIADECYKRIKGKFGGYYFLWKPILMVKDVELIKNIFIKDFEAFPDRPRFLNFHSTDEIVRSLFFMTYDDWKRSRMAFSHLFTPKRLKSMAEQVEKVSISSKSRFLTMAKNDEDVDLEKNLLSITMDVITTSFIGISIKDQEIFHTVSHYTNFLNISDFLKGLLYMLYPQIFDYFKMTALNKNIHELFSDLVKDVVEERKKSNVAGDDLFEFLIKCQNGENKHIEGMSNREIAAHVFVFFFAGHDTTAGTGSFALYELAKNPKVQTRLRDEVQAAVKKNNGLTYDAIKDIPYLQWIISETARMYPVLGVLKRTCMKPCKLDNFEVPVGTEIVIPSRALHYDPEYFPNPTAFNPERYADGYPEVYMPFGKGPRICIGMRFAQMTLSLLISSIILEYNLKTSDKNKEPLRFSTSTAITNKPEGGLWIKMELRNKDF